MVKKMKKVIRNPHADPDYHQKLPLLKGRPLPTPAKFGRRPFPRSSVILFTEWQKDHITSALLAEVIDNNVTRKNTEKVQNFVKADNT